MDTWATSSLTPQIASRWQEDADLFARVFPMDLRPQAHDIIRTWLFDTVLRAHLEHGSLPWSDAAISGWVLDPGPQEDVQVQGQRRHAAGAARGARVRRRPLLGGQRPARGRHGVRRGADACRPPSGHQAAERVEVRPRQDRAARRRHARARPRHADEPEPRRRSRRQPTSRATTTRARSSAPRASSGSSATTTWSWSRRGATATTARRARRRPISALRHGAVGAVAAVRARSCRLRPRRCGRGGSRARCTARPGRRPRSCAPSWAPTTSATSSSLDLAVRVLGEVRKKKSEEQRPMKTAARRVLVRDHADRLERLEAGAARLRWPPASSGCWRPPRASCRGGGSGGGGGRTPSQGARQ